MRLLPSSFSWMVIARKTLSSQNRAQLQSSEKESSRACLKLSWLQSLYNPRYVRKAPSLPGPDLHPKDKSHLHAISFPTPSITQMAEIGWHNMDAANRFRLLHPHCGRSQVQGDSYSAPELRSHTARATLNYSEEYGEGGERFTNTWLGRSCDAATMHVDSATVYGSCLQPEDFSPGRHVASPPTWLRTLHGLPRRDSSASLHYFPSNSNQAYQVNMLISSAGLQ
jgi:hypothetical protein